MYKPVDALYLKMKFLHTLMNESLNKKAKAWYGRPIYYSHTDFHKLPAHEQKTVGDLQDEYYDRMYYELEYHAVIDQPKTFQSFYFFFRQIALAGLLLLLINLLLSSLSFIPNTSLNPIDLMASLSQTTFLIVILIVSVCLARWYRKRMVMKMYWAYFTHINQN